MVRCTSRAFLLPSSSSELCFDFTSCDTTVADVHWIRLRGLESNLLAGKYCERPACLATLPHGLTDALRIPLQDPRVSVGAHHLCGKKGSSVAVSKLYNWPDLVSPRVDLIAWGTTKRGRPTVALRSERTSTGDREEPLFSDPHDWRKITSINPGLPREIWLISFAYSTTCPTSLVARRLVRIRGVVTSRWTAKRQQSYTKSNRDPSAGLFASRRRLADNRLLSHLPAAEAPQRGLKPCACEMSCVPAS